MRIRAASANFTLSSLEGPLDLRLGIQHLEKRAAYLPFCISSFLLDGTEEFFVAANAVTGRVQKEEDGIKIFVSGSQGNESTVDDRSVVAPSPHKMDVSQRVTRRIRGKTVQHLQTDLVYFPGVVMRRPSRRLSLVRKPGLFVNLSSGTLHSIPELHLRDLEVDETLSSAFESEASSKFRNLPGRSLPCLASEGFVRWLIECKKERLGKAVVVNRIFCSYKPFYIFQYYARRPRALKRYECCSVSAETGAWSNYAHKILEYDMLRSHGVVQEGSCPTLTDEVILGPDEARRVAAENVRKLPGVISVRFGGSEVVYLPLWTVHLDEPEFVHQIEVCGVTGYVVTERTCCRQAES